MRNTVSQVIDEFADLYINHRKPKSKNYIPEELSTEIWLLFVNTWQQKLHSSKIRSKKILHLNFKLYKSKKIQRYAKFKSHRT
jgi:hypothetical protein